MVELQVGIEHPKVEENGGGDLAGKVVRLLSLEFAITFHIDHHSRNVVSSNNVTIPAFLRASDNE